jgi:hypothetical protein
MACHFRVPCCRALLRILLLLALTVLVCVAAFAQENPSPAPKYEIFLGYQWLHPGATLPAPGFTLSNPVSQVPDDMPWGIVGSFTDSLYKNLGIEAEFGYSTDSDVTEITTSAGPHLVFRYQRILPFLHALPGWNHLEPPGLSSRNGFGVVLGGGLIIQATRRFGIRLGGDYVYARQHFDDIVPPQYPDLRRVMMNGVRASIGPVFDLGSPSKPLPTASCSAVPSEVLAGEPVTVTATAKNFDPKHTLKYEWGSTGGKITGSGSTASIETTGVAGGTYTATVRITDPKTKEGGGASSSASFVVKELPKNPPTMSCTASPSRLQAGESSTITCRCTSPDNVSATVTSWKSNAGGITGSGGTATLNTNGASPGEITVSAICTDSRGLTSQVTPTPVNVEAPPPQPPQAKKLNSCDFGNMAKIGRPWRVDNECKGVLDDVGKNLQQNADNNLVIVGNTLTAEPTNLGAERAVDAKAYLATGEAKLGIDPSRIETRTGSAGAQTVEFWIVPPDGKFALEGTQPVDESKVKPIPDQSRPAPKNQASGSPKP